MISPQTKEILLAIVEAAIYCGAVAAIGGVCLRLFISQRRWEALYNRLGVVGEAWLGFVIGQGITSVVWLSLSLAGGFQPWVVWVFCVCGWLVILTLTIAARAQIRGIAQAVSAILLALAKSRTVYFWLTIGLVLISLLAGFLALLPTGIDDALRWYLVLPFVIATHHKLELLPFLMPYYGLHPLQVEMHWAALFAISNETAVAVWDYLCAMSYLLGIGLLATIVTNSRRVAIMAILMMLSTSGFFYLIGGGKPDNAAAQYGAAAFIVITFSHEWGRRAALVAGLCIGWALASRYTNVFFVPGLLVFAVMLVWRHAESSSLPRKSRIADLLVAGAAAGIALAPMLIKNWLLVGCPFAPAYGCQTTVWSGVEWAKTATWVHNHEGLSILDLLSYPLSWTFAYHTEMLGNISPLFLGSVPLLLLYRRAPAVRAGLAAGGAGLISIITWWLFVNRLFPYVRWVLLPVGLFAISLGSAIVAAEEDLRVRRGSRWLIRAAVVTVLVCLLFQSRGVVYALRYVAGIDSRRAIYESKPGYDVALWLNQNMRSGQRVAFAGWNGYAYFVRPDHLVNSESVIDFERLWEFCHCRSPNSWTPEFWNFYADAGFDYAIIDKNLVNTALAVSPPKLNVELAYLGRSEAVLRIAKPTRDTTG